VRGFFRFSIFDFRFSNPEFRAGGVNLKLRTNTLRLHPFQAFGAVAADFVRQNGDLHSEVAGNLGAGFFGAAQDKRQAA
jgi:hypothetical protein